MVAIQGIVGINYPGREGERIAANPVGRDSKRHPRMSIRSWEAEAFRDGMRRLNREDSTTGGLPLGSLPHNRATRPAAP